MLYYSLVENPLLSGEEENYNALVKHRVIHTNETIIQSMAVPGGVTRVQAKAVIEAFACEACRILEQGEAINCELFSAYPVIKGRFKNRDDRFDKERHALKLDVRPSERFKKALTNVKKRVLEGAKRSAKISRVYNSRIPGKEDTSFLPGDHIVIEGARLYFNQDDPGQGLFLSSSQITVPLQQCPVNRASLLIGVIPGDMGPGSYTLTHKTILHGNKSVSNCMFDDPISVKE